MVLTYQREPFCWSPQDYPRLFGCVLWRWRCPLFCLTAGSRVERDRQWDIYLLLAARRGFCMSIEQHSKTLCAALFVIANVPFIKLRIICNVFFLQMTQENSAIRECSAYSAVLPRRLVMSAPNVARDRVPERCGLQQPFRGTRCELREKKEARRQAVKPSNRSQSANARRARRRGVKKS